MIDPRNATRLIPRLKQLVAGIEREHDFVVHQKINQFYYMQKAVELKELLEQLEEGQDRIEKIMHRLGATYSEVFTRWNQDARWLARQRSRSDIER